MLILGLSSFRHHTSAAILQDGVVRAAIENHKLWRSSSQGLPNASIRFCLESVGATWSDLDVISIATRPVRAWLNQSLLHGRMAARVPLAGAYYEANEIDTLTRHLNELRMLRQKNGGGHKTIHFDHHLCHAAAAFFMSPFDRALILTLDEDGDGDSGMIAIGEDKKIRVLRKISFPNSLAWVYSLVTDLIGFLPRQEEHKTQWLSLEGDPEFEAVFLDMLRTPHSPVPRLDYNFVNRGFAKRFTFSAKFYQKIGFLIDQRHLGEDQRRALASSIQAACTDIVTDLIQDLCRQHGIPRVCLGGGLFQNALLVASLEKNLGINRLFVPPAPGNAGTAVGAAQLGWHQVSDTPRMEPVSHVYWGPKFSGQQIKDVLDNSKSRFFLRDTEERTLDATLGLLKAGKIVAWV
jgi:carbamoyltransferase